MPADGSGAAAAGRPGDDQAACGGGRRAPALARGHASPKTTKLYDRTAATVTVDEIERIVILNGAALPLSAWATRASSDQPHPGGSPVRRRRVGPRPPPRRIGYRRTRPAASSSEQDEAPAAWQTAKVLARLICSRLVDDEHVHRAGHLLARPQPRGAAGEVRFARGEGLGHLSVGAGLDDALVRTAVAVVRLLDPRAPRPALATPASRPDSPPVRPFSTGGPSAASYTSASRLEITLW